MANVDNPHGFQVERNETGAAIPIEYATLDTSQTIAAGDMLYWNDTTGYLQIYTAAATTVAGVAAEAKTTSAGSTSAIGYYPATSNLVFSGQCSGTPTQAKIGDAVDVEGTTGIMEINEDASSVGIIRLIGLNPRSTMGLNAELNFKFVQSKVTA